MLELDSIHAGCGTRHWSVIDHYLFNTHNICVAVVSGRIGRSEELPFALESNAVATHSSSGTDTCVDTFAEALEGRP